MGEYTSLAKWDESFQQLLADFWWDHHGEGREPPDRIPVYECDLDDHRLEWIEGSVSWTEGHVDDLGILIGMISTLTALDESSWEDKLPPFVVSGGEGGLLRDGYHRWAALTLLGRTTWPAIDLDQWLYLE